MERIIRAEARGGHRLLYSSSDIRLKKYRKIDERFSLFRYVSTSSNKELIRNPHELIMHLNAKHLRMNYNNQDDGRINQTMMPAKYGGIYLLYCIANDKPYIGKASSFQKRGTEHNGHLRNKDHINQHLQNAFNLYGFENFIFFPLEIVHDLSELGERELYWSKVYDSFKNGFNQAPIISGGEAGDSFVKNRVRGESHPNARRTKNDIIRICEMLNLGMEQADIAKELNEDSKFIHKIAKGLQWKEVTSKYLTKDFKEKAENKAPATRLSENDIIEICILLNKGGTCSSIAKKFGVKRDAIRSIKAGRRNRNISINFLSNAIINTWVVPPA